MCVNLSLKTIIYARVSLLFKFYRKFTGNFLYFGMTVAALWSSFEIQQTLNVAETREHLGKKII